MSRPNFAKDQLKQIIEKIERLEDERGLTGKAIGDVYKEAKGYGFNGAIMRKVIRLRAMDTEKRIEQDELLDLYMHALGETS